MFLPNTDSFVLIRKTIVKSNFPVFLPSTDSFLLIRRSIVRPSFTPEVGTPQSTDGEQSKIKDHGKRNFLKAAGVAGAGVIASQLFSPKKAQAFIMGSSPTTGVVGVKDSTNERIDPATEGTLSEVLKKTDLSLNAGVLDVKVTSVSGEGSSSFSDSGDVARSALVDADRHVQVDVVNLALPPSAATETTLQTMSFGGFKFALRMATVGNIDYVGEAVIGTATTAASWRIKRVDSGTIIESGNTGIIIQWAGDDAGSAGTFDQVWDNHATTVEYF